MKYSKRFNPRLVSAYAGLALTLLAPSGAFAQADHEKLTTAAWNCFKATDYTCAITNAQACIEDWREAAKDLQTKLEKAGKEVPTGKVSNEVKEAIFANGPLNDVATCYFIIGEANRPFVRTNVEKLKAAKAAYEEARKLTFGRCWDPNGWFWSPAETASQRLRALPPVPTSK